MRLLAFLHVAAGFTGMLFIATLTAHGMQVPLMRTKHIVVERQETELKSALSSQHLKIPPTLSRLPILRECATRFHGTPRTHAMQVPLTRTKHIVVAHKLQARVSSKANEASLSDLLDP